MPATSLPALGSVVAYEQKTGSFRAGETDRREAERVRGDARLDAGAAVAELFDDEDVVDLVDAHAAVLRRQGRVHEADLPRVLEDLFREDRIAIALCRDGDDALLREAARRLDQCFLFLGELEVDHGCSLLIPSRARDAFRPAHAPRGRP
jgi:hypothetical protein